MAHHIILVDTMIVIEAVDTGCWNAITGQRQVVTVPACEDELLQGDASARGYIAVGAEETARMTIQAVSPAAAVNLRLKYPDADRLDRGERDLLALATTITDEFDLCSCDRAAVRAAHALGWLDRVVSLEGVAASVGARPSRSFKRQYTETFLRAWRTDLRLEGDL